MSAQHAATSQSPAPLRGRAATPAALFGLVGGPLAWFTQLCAGYALASWPCFPQDRRTLTPLAGYAWSFPVMNVLLLGGIAVALAAFLTSWRIFARTRSEAGGDSRALPELGRGRTRFLALWGMLLGAGFAVATALTAIAFVVLPRCAG